MFSAAPALITVERKHGVARCAPRAPVDAAVAAGGWRLAAGGWRLAVRTAWSGVLLIG
jgi:hypothetical protein